MSDILNQLEPAQLSVLVALEIAGWKNTNCSVANPFDRGGMRLPNGFADRDKVFTAWWHPSDEIATGCYIAPPRFAESSDAVLPLLEKFAGYKAERFGDYPPRNYYTIRVYPSLMYVETYRQEFTGQGITFAYAACIALLRAYRAGKGPA